MVSLGEKYRHLLEGELSNSVDSSDSSEDLCASRSLDTLFYSSGTGGVVENSVTANPRYWQTNLTSPVGFHSAVRRILQRQRNLTFLEIGPHSTLAGPLRQICAEVGSDCSYAATMIRNKGCADTLLSAWGHLLQQGIPLNFTYLVQGGSVLPDLPYYP